MSTPHTCLNCSTEFHGKFCPNCGQDASLGRITFAITFQRFMSSAFSFEGPLLPTTWGLIKNPGEVFREFLAGQRKKYYQPVSFFILTTVVYLLCRSLLHYDPLTWTDFNDPEIRSSGQISEAARYMVKNINNFLLFLVLSLGLSMRLVFGKKYYLSEYVAISFYVAGVYAIFSILHMVIQIYIIDGPSMLHGLFYLLYITYVSVSFREKLSFGNILRALLISLLSYVFYVVLAFGLAYLLTL